MEVIIVLKRSKNENKVTLIYLEDSLVGYLLTSYHKRKVKSMKRANQSGSVYKLNGRRRRPWAVRVTTGWQVDGRNAKQVRKMLGYYKTKKEANEALSAYLINPYDLDKATITFAEIYTKWSEEHSKHVSASAMATYRSAFNWSKSLHELPIRDIKTVHLEDCIRNCGAPSTAHKLKSFYSQLWRHAMKHDICEKNYGDLCTSAKEADPIKKRSVFTDEEIRILWQYLTDRPADPTVKMILVQIYSGWRPSELISMTIKDGVMYGGSKTEAGRDRVVPIHSLIKPLLPESGKPYQMSYSSYRRKFLELMSELGMDHTPHECRHTFITLAKRAKMNDHVLKLLVGHYEQDLTESVYTHRTIEELKTEIEKIRKTQGD